MKRFSSHLAQFPIAQFHRNCDRLVSVLHGLAISTKATAIVLSLL
jgi:hypothetical protein